MTQKSYILIRQLGAHSTDLYSGEGTLKDAQKRVKERAASNTDCIDYIVTQIEYVITRLGGIDIWQRDQIITNSEGGGVITHGDIVHNRVNIPSSLAPKLTDLLKQIQPQTTSDEGR